MKNLRKKVQTLKMKKNTHQFCLYIILKKNLYVHKNKNALAKLRYCAQHYELYKHHHPKIKINCAPVLLIPKY